jgi:hypothetical protein
MFALKDYVSLASRANIFEGFSRGLPGVFLPAETFIVTGVEQDQKSCDLGCRLR